jgi:hypothetical protein
MKRLLLAGTAFLGLAASEPGAHARGPTEIEKCQTISQPGSYKLVNNLTFTGTTGTCLPITADFVTIDLAGFTISGPGNVDLAETATAVAAGDNITGIAVRNGSISGFASGVNLGGQGSIVEELRVFNGTAFGIVATGIVKGNTAVDIFGGPGNGVGIFATGIVTGNYASDNHVNGILVGRGSTVIGNTATGGEYGMFVSCPSNVTDNTASLFLEGNGCNNTNNVGP